ncbi:MAG: formamidopyrimidine-DNA glycosylase [Phycisphaerales bacterium]|nr:formamidopyrimidine-DNA glycosylase [Phycisphaerales bacterium]
MPELPDVTIYIESLQRRLQGATLKRLRIKSPFLLRTFDPPTEAVEGRAVTAISRLGKRIAIEFDNGLFAIIHLMIAGRFRWLNPHNPPNPHDPHEAKPAATSKIELARFEFDTGTLILTEASKKKRASLHMVASREQLIEHTRGGLDVLTCSTPAFIERLRSENHTLKRALASPKRFDGIGNAYGDEILHAAKLSPTQLTRNLDDEEASRLHHAARGTLTNWIARLRADFALDTPHDRFPAPGEITAFRPEFAVHGKFGKRCPICGTKVQRIIYAENECNYCPTCQTNGKVLADRSLSRLLKDDWPATVEEWE